MLAPANGLGNRLPLLKSGVFLRLTDRHFSV